jgi:hypothetical protein
MALGDFTKADCLLMLNLLGERTVVEPSKEFPYRISVRDTGYSSDPVIGKLQAKLSIWLEIAIKREA